MVKSEQHTWLKKSAWNEKDEYYTPRILVEPILKYIPTDAVVWCPFDTEHSEFVLALKDRGNKVIHSHIWEGKDFFKYEPNEYDYVISNPPFTQKLEVFERLYKLGKPFAMIMGLPILNYQEVGNFFYNLDEDLQLLIVDKKVSFDGNTASFNNSYFCWNMLPKAIVFEHLANNNSKGNFIGSRMHDDVEPEEDKTQLKGFFE
jgi:hypothetical protein|tara:strand:- start:2561 stop:3169 length:609 start_codon:yes stop_codon:yes gene_type:complete